MQTVKGLFDHVFHGVTIDRAFLKRVYHFQVGFVNKNESHMRFFGGNLTGVEPVRFTDQDYARFFDQVCHVDADDIETGIRRLPAINQDFKVSSDPFNLTCMYLIHRCLTTSEISPEEQQRGALDIGLVFFYRCLTALLAHYFRYPADPKTAQAAYAGLSQRFLIKQLGTWQAVLVYRAEELVKTDGLHRKTLESFVDDGEIVKMVNDSQGRIRDILKGITAEHHKAKNANEAIYTTSATITDVEGEEVIRDKTHGTEAYLSYLSSVLTDRDSFIKNELIGVVLKVSYTTPAPYLVKTLEYVVETSLDHRHTLVDELLRLTLTVSFNYLHENEFSISGRVNIPVFLSMLKGCYTSAKSKDPDLERLRDVGYELVHKANGRLNHQVTASIRTSLFLYVALRAYLKAYYIK